MLLSWSTVVRETGISRGVLIIKVVIIRVVIKGVLVTEIEGEVNNSDCNYKGVIIRKFLTVNDLNEKVSEKFEDIYRQKEKTLKRFFDSDFYYIKLENPALSSEMNQLIYDHYNPLIGHPKPVLSTKLKLSGKLPGIHPIKDLIPILKQSFNFFSTLKEKCKIKAAWKFSSGFFENKDEKKMQFKSTRTLDTEDYIQEYSSTCKFSSKDSIRLPGFESEIKIQFLIVSFSDNDLVQFKISDKDLNITKIVEMTEKSSNTERVIALTDSEHTIGRFLKSIAL
ncbi:hypothetical protein CWI38_0090p0030 [Hamiltosporidium tvaerminnensis]|uniref:Uncharacterized protein n=1 Tax=Hamiltosporidium tvaerminnensis TaxID=1176355 RepID=A0A4Q9M2C3_9MICR|nr:hypothetical protein CWI38_0090p0030 [Hamiltosporidium tvaerminnensis]